MTSAYNRQKNELMNSESSPVCDSFVVPMKTNVRAMQIFYELKSYTLFNWKLLPPTKSYKITKDESI